MKINEITARPLRIPFNAVFSHASATRLESQSIFVEIESVGSEMGHGEGCPRRYVTDETVDTALEFINTQHDSILEVSCAEDLRQWVRENQSLIDKNPAAFCSVELAVIDLLAKSNSESVESLLSLKQLSGEFQYTAVLDAQNLSSFNSQLNRYLRIGFTDFKIKISGDLKLDQAKVNCLVNNVPDSTIRLDANNFWTNTTDAETYIQELGHEFLAVEEPLKVGNFRGCRHLSKTLKTPIILDESFLCIEHFQHIEDDPEYWIINLRISKMGGILRSLAIIDKAKELKIPIVVGAQVGETSILTRAALAVANNCREILLAQEGAFGTHLLKYDITDEPISFGEKGKIIAPFRSESKGGFGLNIESERTLSTYSSPG